MHKSFVKLFLVIVLMIFVTPQAVSAMPEILPFDQLKSGMSGKAYTVVDGSGKIENFDIKIIGLTDEGKGSKRMIMAQAEGEVIKRTGGILQGMSGSPVYVDGKLIGALAATLKEMDPYTVFITPIESMVELWNLPDPKARENFLKIAAAEKERNKSKEDKPEDKGDSTAEEINPEDKDDSTIEEVKLEDKEDSTTEEVDALYINGFDASGIKFLQRELGLNNLQTSPTIVERGIQLDATLEPGSAVGVAIVYGDFSLGATGTVTVVDGRHLLAFGHSFTHSGNVNYFMTDASVIGSVSGATGNGVKLANIGKIIGRINQDRESGISGILGTFPAVVPINVKVHDNILDKEETYNAAIAYNENLIPKLGAAIAYTALNKMADSTAEGTVEIDFNIKTNAVAGGELARKNMFYNASDVGQVAILELMQALNIVCSNTKEESNIFGVDVNIFFDTERRTASIVSITPDKKVVKPGETINLTVELQPYRKPTEKVVMPYTIPFNAQQGNLLLEIHGGALVPANQAMANTGLGTADSNKSYEDKIKDFLKLGKNNQLVVEVGGSNEAKTEKQIRREIAQVKRLQARLKKEGKSIKRADSRVETNYIIDNFMRTTLSVEKV